MDDRDKALALVDNMFDDSLPVDEDTLLLMKTLFQESDRGCVLVGAAYLDDELELMLRTNFSNDEKTIKKTINLLFKGGNAPLSSFWAKTNIAFALELINNETYSAINKVRELRNSFAHKAGPAILTDDSVAPIISKLEKYIQKATKAFRETIDEILLEAKAVKDDVKPPISGQKLEFILAIGFIASNITKGRK